MRKPSEGSYSVWMGFVYVSNLIVGTGALTMPLAIAKAGLWISIPMLGTDMILPHDGPRNGSKKL